MARQPNADLDALGVPAVLVPDRPKGDQLREIIEDLASRNSPGDRMPSERSIAGRFGVARMTVRNEFKKLVDDGVLVARPGSGTNVAEASSTAHSIGMSYSSFRWPPGVTPGATVLEHDVLQLSERQSLLLDVPSGSRAVRIVRLRTVNGEPVGIERSTLSLLRFPGLEDVDLSQVSLYGTLAERWSVQGARAEGRVSAVLPRRDEALQLKITMNQPCVFVDLATRDENGKVIEVGRSIYRGDRYDLFISYELPANSAS